MTHRQEFRIYCVITWTGSQVSNDLIATVLLMFFSVLCYIYSFKP